MVCHELFSRLRAVADAYLDAIAVTDGIVALTYAQLLAQVEAEAADMQRQPGFRDGQFCALPVRQQTAYIVSLLAIHRAGGICVPVETATTLPANCLPAVSDMLFTSGSTGQPKGVLLSERAILADAENLIAAHGYHAGLTFVICGPIHHFGCWSKVLPTLLTGGTLHILEGLKDVESLFAVLDGATPAATFLVPTAIRMLLQLHHERLSAVASHIEFIETGAAPIATSDMERLRTLLPHTRLYNTYASTETGVVCTYPFHGQSATDAASAPCLQGCVGPTMQHARLRFDDEQHIIVSGPMIMSGYLQEQHDSMASDVALASAPTEIRTSDIGHLSPEGYLIITGRDSDFINVGGLKVAPSVVEDAAMSYPGIEDCICIAAPHPLMGQVPRLLVVMKPGIAFDRRPLIAHLKARLATYQIPLSYEPVSDILKTFNGKKDRKAYRV